MADCGVIINNLNLRKGHGLALKGLIPKYANGFAINLGKDASNFILHFNARFNLHGDTNTIVCNSKESNYWGAEQRERAFPFKQGEETSLFFIYREDKVIVKLPDGTEFSFPVRMHLDTISFLSLDGLVMNSLSMA
ncbi:galectin-1-like isoform X2 [Bombina bombina]|uniref:galectin-1-like isoform X2 n=1 Tax=Bombina bombina TaxID=8345 RepID=UPI00235A8CA7|nr:galectin-1-like isoform X2 [Bombina bombina]